MIKTKKCAILHLQIELNKTCGVSRSILRIIKNSHNYEHHVISLGGDALDRFDLFNLKIIKANRNSLYGTLKIFFTTLKYIKQNHIQIVHSHHRYFDLLASLLKTITSIRTVTTVHSKVYKKKLFSYKSEKLIVVSNTIKLHLIQYFNINPSKIYLINNFVDKNEISITQKKEEIFSELGLSPDTPLIGYFGRLDIKEKGVDILLEALQMIIVEMPSVFLILAGNGIDEQLLKKIALNKKLPARFLGNISNIWNYLNACDIVVLPSRVEPFNLVMIEAGLISKTVIGARVDGIAETIKDRLTGILFIKENAIDLKNKIIELLKDKNLMDSLRQNLHEEVMCEFTSEIIIPRIENFYNQLLL
ncbi:MAG: glycosyltransferase family 4 protein [Ignavibacteriaceae bacterium]|nr:glycosyltransferase family 4 protein [Ignavibacteriaceae bacterium]